MKSFTAPFRYVWHELMHSVYTLLQKHKWGLRMELHIAIKKATHRYEMKRALSVNWGSEK